MNQYIGLDVSMKETAVSIRQDGKRVWRGKCASDPQLLAAVIRNAHRMPSGWCSRRGRRAVSFEGKTGPYLQYAAVRVSAILKKAEDREFQFGAELGSTERALALLCLSFPAAVERAIESYEPSEIASYAFDLAQTFSRFYAESPVTGSLSNHRTTRSPETSNTAVKTCVPLVGLSMVALTPDHHGPIILPSLTSRTGSESPAGTAHRDCA